LVVPPLLLAGTPSFMAEALLDPLLARAVTRRPLRALTRPLPALAAWSVALFAWHLPGPYAAALDSHALHFAQHATLVGAAVLMWVPAAIVPLAAFTAVFFRWAAEESEDRAEGKAFPE